MAKSYTLAQILYNCTRGCVYYDKRYLKLFQIIFSYFFFVNINYSVCKYA